MKKLASIILTCSAGILSSGFTTIVQNRDDLQLSWRTSGIQGIMVDITNRLACRYQSLGALFARHEHRHQATPFNQNEDNARVMQLMCLDSLTKGQLCTIIFKDTAYGTAPLGRDATEVKRDVSRKLKRLYMLAKIAKSDVIEIYNDTGTELTESQFCTLENAISAIEDALEIFQDVCMRANDETRVFTDNLFIWHTVNFAALFPSLNFLEQCLYRSEQIMQSSEISEPPLPTKCVQDRYTWCWNESSEILMQWVFINLVLDAETEKKKNYYVSKLFGGLWKRVTEAEETRRKLVCLFDKRYDRRFDDADARSYKSRSALIRNNRLAKDLFDALQQKTEKIRNKLRKAETKIHQKFRFRNPVNYFLILEHKKVGDRVASLMLTIKETQMRQEMHMYAFSRRPPLTWYQRLAICFYD